MLLIDDDQPQLRERQEQRRAGADHDPALAGARPPPRPGGGAAAATPECHSAGSAPKRSAIRAITAWVSAISGSRISTWAVRIAAQGRGGGLEIDLGLARAGDAVEQGDREAAARRPSPPARPAPRPGSGSASAPARSGSGAGKVDRRLAQLFGQHAVGDQRVDHAGADARRPRQRRRARASPRAPPPAPCARAGVMRAGALAGRDAPPARAWPSARPGAAQRDRQRLAGLVDGVARRPVDEGEAVGRQRRRLACVRPPASAAGCRRRASRRAVTTPRTSRGPSGTATMSPSASSMPSGSA